MEKLIQEFKNHVVEACNNPNFVHHEWYVKYHLNFVEKISLELCEKYPEANKDIVLTAVKNNGFAL